MGPRRLDVDLAKAIGIVAVVLIHSLRSSFWPWISSGEAWLALLLQFAVPAFFAASGVLAASAERIPPSVTRARLRRLLVPYLIASVAAQVFRASFSGEPPGVARLLSDFLLATSFGPYYYVFHAVLFVLATPWLARLAPRTLTIVFGAALLAQWVVWLFPEIGPSGFHDPLHWFAFFLAGWWLRRNEALARAWLAERRGTVLGLAGLGATLLSTHSLLESGPRLAAAFQWLFVACVLVLIFAAGLGRETRSRAIRFLSDASYTIYLFHLFFVLPAQRALPAPPRVFDPAAIAVPFVLGMLGSLGLVVAGRALLGARSRTWLGS
jgi:fucose 4-O-acetylase-like acetyltransferase